MNDLGVVAVRDAPKTGKRVRLNLKAKTTLLDDRVVADKLQELLRRLGASDNSLVGPSQIVSVPVALGIVLDNQFCLTH